LGCRSLYCQMPWNKHDGRIMEASKIGFKVTNLQAGLEKIRTRYYECDKPHSNIKVVMIHPWGIFGGSSVDLHLIATRLCDMHNLDVLTFDGRGCGTSSGRSTVRSLKEVADARTVCAWLTEGFACPIVTIGFGIGACIAGSLLPQQHVLASIAVGYPLSFPYNYLFQSHHDAFFKSDKPRMMMYGNNDEYTHREVYEEYINKASPGLEKFVYNGPHFSNNLTDGYDRNISNYIARYVAKVEMLYGIAMDLGNPPPRIKFENRTYGVDFTQEVSRRALIDYRKDSTAGPRQNNSDRAFPNAHIYDLF